MLVVAMHNPICRSDDPSAPIDSAQALRERCQACLDEVLAQTSSIRFACLGTADGRLFTAQSGAADAQRFAAMTSSLIALSESFAKEALRSPCTHSLVVTQRGVIVSVRIPTRRQSYVLSLGSDATDAMALVLRRALDASEVLARLIDSAA